MNIALYIVIGILGLIIGSFLNVVILRLHTKRISKGRSKCTRCGHTLEGMDLIPVLSFIMLGGRCRYCKTRLSVQYPLVELITAVLFVFLGFKIFGTSQTIDISGIILFLGYSTIFSSLIALSVYDIRHYILPWKIMRVFLITAFVLSIAIGILGQGVNYTNVVSGFIVALPLWFVWYFSRGKMIGFGDIELICGFGFILGISGGFAATLLGFWAAAAFVFLKMIFTMKVPKGKDSIPFGPFLVLGFFIAFIFNITMSSFIIGLL